MTVEEVLAYLDQYEIDYRLESNFCCGYIFYFLDGSVYPRRYMDYVLEGDGLEVLAESVDNVIERSLAYELKKDWKHRIEADSINKLFKLVEEKLSSEYSSLYINKK